MIAVKTITPRCDPSFALSVQEPATVTPYYVAELDAQVAGRVELIRKSIQNPAPTKQIG